MSDLIQATGFGSPASIQRSQSLGRAMQSSQHKSLSAPSLHSSLAERARPSVPRFAESTDSMIPQQPLDMAGFENIQGKEPHLSSFSSPSLICSTSGSESWGDFSVEPAALDMREQSFAGEYTGHYNGSTAGFPTLEHSSSTESQTISPSEMHISCPPSEAWTYQSTPQTDLMSSPACFSNDPSPAWAYTDSPTVNDNMDFDSTEIGLQMFPDLPLHNENKQEVIASEPVARKSIAMSRKGSSPGKTSPTSHPVGITKKKKSRGPLPDIKVDPNDPVAVKRARNTAAARTSRERKAQRVDYLEKELELWKNRAIAAGWRDEDEEQYEPI